MRQRYIDVARGIAIICIILGHLGCASINRVVFTFHVPVFFLITGYFMNESGNLKDFVLKKARKLLVPYFVTATAMVILAVITNIGSSNIGEIALEWVDAAIWGAGGKFIEPVYVKGIGAIWFLWASFWGSIFLRISLKYNKWVRIAMILLLFAFGYFTRNIFWLPFGIQPGACAALFMYIGYVIRKSENEIRLLPKETKIFATVFAAIVWIQFMRDFKSFWLVQCDVGRGIVDVFGSICASILILMISYLVSSKINVLDKLLAYCGRYSIFVLCIHNIELYFFPWSRLADMAVLYGMSHSLYMVLLIICKLTVNLCGAYILSKSRIFRKIFAIKQ